MPPPGAFNVQLRRLQRHIGTQEVGEDFDDAAVDEDLPVDGVQLVRQLDARQAGILD